MRPIIAIVGPTATGKTVVGVELAKLVNGEIISADSMAVYRGMDVGTAKPTPQERQAIPFHLIDVVDPADRYNVSLFKEQAERALEEIEGRGTWPILVGGTGLYVRALLEGFGLTETAADPSVRSRFAELALETLRERLLEVDPVSAQRIHPNDRVRTERALEVFEVSGRPISVQQSEDARRRSRREALKFGLTAPREALYTRIDSRVDAMVENGLVAEVKQLLDAGNGRNLPALQSLGYREVITYLEGRTTLDEAVEEIKRNTRRFAKRQLTWFRTDREIVWLDIHGKTVPEITQEIVKRLPT